MHTQIPALFQKSEESWVESESPDEVQSQVQTPKIKRSNAPLDFRILYCHLSTPPTPPHPTLNFSNTSRGPTPKCYTFLETSHDPRLGWTLRSKNFANFLQPVFIINKSTSLLGDLPLSVIYLFGNLSWPPTWIQTQMQKFCTFCNPFLQTTLINS